MAHQAKGPVAGEIMTKKVVTLRSTDTVTDATDRLLKAGVSNAPVVDNNELVGFTTLKDILQQFANGSFYSEPDMTIGQIMHIHPVKVTEDVDLYSLATIFVQFGFRHLPVIRDKALVGIVSRIDVLQALNNRYQTWLKNGANMHEAPDLQAIFTRRFTLGSKK